MKSQVFIPSRCKVGFQKRDDTYTKKLGYIIYHDGKAWRKEKSWSQWCMSVTYDPAMAPMEFPNIPTYGFVLNKKVGGVSGGWNQRQAYIRVYDPRGFEFEITLANLLYILENTNSIKGKGLEGSFVYGWYGTELVLIPEDAPEYKSMLKFTQVKNAPSLKASDLKPGYIYTANDGNNYTFVSYSDLHNYFGIKTGKKVYWFLSLTSCKFVRFSIKSIKVEVGQNTNFVNELAKAGRYKQYHGLDESKLERLNATTLESIDSYKTVYEKVGQNFVVGLIIKSAKFILRPTANYIYRSGKNPGINLSKKELLNKELYIEKS